MRHAREAEDFDSDRYLGDFFAGEEDPMYSEAMDFQAHWQKPETGEGFTDEEKAAMMQMKNKEYLIEQERRVMLGMIDIMLAYAYDHRTTLGEPTVINPKETI